MQFGMPTLIENRTLEADDGALGAGYESTGVLDADDIDTG